MAITEVPSAYGFEKVNTEWSDADRAFFAMLRNAGLPITFDIKEAFFTWRQQIGGGGGSGIQMRRYQVGTPEEDADPATIDNTVVVPGPATIPDILSNISGGKPLAVFIGSQYSEPNEYQQTNFINDVNVYVLVRLS